MLLSRSEKNTEYRPWLPEGRTLVHKIYTWYQWYLRDGNILHSFVQPSTRYKVKTIFDYNIIINTVVNTSELYYYIIVVPMYCVLPMCAYIYPMGCTLCLFLFLLYGDNQTPNGPACGDRGNIFYDIISVWLYERFCLLTLRRVQDRINVQTIA